MYCRFIDQVPFNDKMQVTYRPVVCNIGKSIVVTDQSDERVSHYTVMGRQKSEFIEGNKMLVQAGVKTWK